VSRNSERPAGLERTSLTTYAPSFREADPANGRSAGARAWHELGLLIANPAHFSWSGATQIKQLAEELYGKRREEAE
jgi:hypothetical protein